MQIVAGRMLCATFPLMDPFLGRVLCINLIRLTRDPKLQQPPTSCTFGP